MLLGMGDEMAWRMLDAQEGHCPCAAGTRSSSCSVLQSAPSLQILHPWIQPTIDQKHLEKNSGKFPPPQIVWISCTLAIIYVVFTMCEV